MARCEWGWLEWGVTSKIHMRLKPVRKGYKLP
jgi:hypothetical protein